MYSNAAKRSQAIELIKQGITHGENNALHSTFFTKPFLLKTRNKKIKSFTITDSYNLLTPQLHD